MIQSLDLILQNFSILLPIPANFSNIMHHTVKKPLIIHLLFCPESKSIRLFSSSDVPEYRFDCAHPLRIDTSTIGWIDFSFHFFRSIFHLIENHDLSGFCMLIPETFRTEFTNFAIHYVPHKCLTCQTRWWSEVSSLGQKLVRHGCFAKWWFCG